MRQRPQRLQAPKLPLHPGTPSSLQAGMCDGMTYEEVAERMPGEFALRRQDKLRYRCGHQGPLRRDRAACGGDGWRQAASACMRVAGGLVGCAA